MCNAAVRREVVASCTARRPGVEWAGPWRSSTKTTTRSLGFLVGPPTTRSKRHSDAWRASIIRTSRRTRRPPRRSSKRSTKRTRCSGTRTIVASTTRWDVIGDRARSFGRRRDGNPRDSDGSLLDRRRNRSSNLAGRGSAIFSRPCLEGDPGPFVDSASVRTRMVSVVGGDRTWRATSSWPWTR